MPNTMRITVTATGMAASQTSLQEVQNAVALALRGQGVTLAFSAVKVEGTLA